MEEISNECENSKFIIDEIVRFAREKVPVDYLYSTRCQESSYAVQSKCYELDLPFCPIINSGIGIDALQHYFTIVKVTENFSFIIDLTYLQFNKETYPVQINGKEVNIISPKKYLSEKNFNELLNNGYILLTKENLAEYMNAFILSLEPYINIDLNEVLNKVEKLLAVSYVTFCRTDNFTFNNNKDKNIKSL